MGGQFSCPAKVLEDWTCSDVESGLRHLGFPQYVPLARKNGVDGQKIQAALSKNTTSELFHALRVSDDDKIWLLGSLQVLPQAIELALSKQQVQDSSESLAFPDNVRRPDLKRKISFATQQMIELSRFLQPHRFDIEKEWTKQLKEIGYPQKQSTTNSQTGIDDAILENFRCKDAQLWTDGVFYFITHSYHRGKLRDRIKQVIESRYIKLGLKLHEIKNALLMFPSVVLEVCRQHGLVLNSAHKNALIEVPRVAMDCTEDVLRELERRRHLSQQTDSSLNEILPCSQLYSVPANTVDDWQFAIAALSRKNSGRPQLPLWGERCMKFAMATPANPTTSVPSAMSRHQATVLWYAENGLIPDDASADVAAKAIETLEKIQSMDRADLFPLIGARVNNRYIIRDYMANGSFAHVWKAFDTREQNHVVLKIFRGIHDLQFDTNTVNVVEEGFQELEINRKLMALDASGELPEELKNGMVRVVDVTKAHSPALLVRKDGLSGHAHFSCSEYCEEKDITYLRTKRSNFEENIAKYIFTQVIKTVAAMHKLKWFHQDLKVENIFVQRDADQRFLFKIGDFGRLVTHDNQAEHERGTLRCLGASAASYVAPEAKKSRDYYYDGGPADVWSSGILLLHLLLDAPSILQSVEWNHRSFISYLAPLNAVREAMRRKRMAYNNRSNFVFESNKAKFGRTFFSDGELKLSSWLDNISFQHFRNVVRDRSSADSSNGRLGGCCSLLQLSDGSVETVWHRGTKVKMKVLATSRADVWYLAEEQMFREAYTFILRYHKAVGTETTATMRDDTSPASKKFLHRVQSDTIRWLRWRPVLLQLEETLQEHQHLFGVQSSSTDRVRRLLYCLADPKYIHHVLRHNPVILPPRRTGKERVLSPEYFSKLVNALKAQRDPTKLMQRLRLHAKDIPLCRGSDDCLGNHLSLHTRLSTATKRSGKISILQYCESEFATGPAKEVLDVMQQWDILHPFRFHTCDVSKLMSRLRIPLLKESHREMKIQLKSFEQTECVWEKRTDELQICHLDFSNVDGGHVSPPNFVVLPALTSEDEMTVHLFMKFAWQLQQLYDDLKYKYENVHGAGVWKLSWCFLEALDSTLHSAVTAADKDLHDSFTAFETELLRRLREQDKVIEVLRGDELHLKEDTRLPPLHYLTPSEPTARRSIDDYRKIDNIHYLKYPYDDLSSWKHFRGRLEKCLHETSPVGRQLLNHLPPELDDLLDRIFRYDPEQRITAADVLCHPWVTAISGDDLQREVFLSLQRRIAEHKQSTDNSAELLQNGRMEHRIEVLCPVAPGELGHDFLRSLLHIVARQLDGHLSTPHPDDVESPPTDTSILDATTVAARREQSINSSASSASEYSLPATDVARGDGPAPTKRKLSLDVSHLDSQIPEEAKKKVSKVSFALDGDDSDSQSSSLDVLDSDSSADEMDEGGNPTPRQGIFHVHVVSDKKPQSENANDSDIDSDSLEIELSSDDEEFGTGNSGIFSVHVSSSDANAQADVDDSAALSSQHTKVPVSHEAEVQPWVYSIEELGVAKNGFVARVAATNVSGAKPIITATWSRGFVAAKWLSLKAHLDEAFSDHVSRFIGAGSELMKQIRMLTLSGRGPQQQEHGMLIVMTSFCDFFVMFHFIRQHNFYLGDNGGNKYCRELESLFQSKEFAQTLFAHDLETQMQIASFFMDENAFPPASSVIQQRLQGMWDKLSRGDLSATISETHDDAKEEEAPLKALYRLYSILDIATRRRGVAGKRSMEDLLNCKPPETGASETKLQRMDTIGVGPPSKEQNDHWARVDANISTLRTSVAVQGHLQTTLTRHEHYLRDLALAARMDRGLYDVGEDITPKALCCTKSTGAAKHVVRHSPHFTHILLQGMHPSPHVEFLHAVHNAIHKIVEALGAKPPWPFTELPRGKRLTLEPTTKDSGIKRLAEFYLLPDHCLAVRPDVGPPPVDGHVVDITKHKLHQLRRKDSNWTDVRDRLIWVQREVFHWRQQMLKDHPSEMRSPHQAQALIPPSEDKVHPDLWEWLQKYEEMAAAGKVDPRTIENGQAAMLRLSKIADLDIRRRFLDHIPRILTAILRTQLSVHQNVSPQCSCLPRKNREVLGCFSQQSLEGTTAAGICRKPHHLVIIVATLLRFSTLHTKTGQFGEVSRYLTHARRLQSTVQSFFRDLPDEKKQFDENERRLKDLDLALRFRNVRHNSAAKFALERSVATAKEQLDVMRTKSFNGSRVEKMNLLTTVGKSHLALRDADSAISCFLEALELTDPLPDQETDLASQPRNSIKVGGLLNNLGKSYALQKRWKAARCYFNQVLSIKINVLGKFHASVGSTSFVLACSFVSEAQEILKEHHTPQLLASANSLLEDASALLVVALMLHLDRSSTSQSRDQSSPPDGGCNRAENMNILCKVAEVYMLLRVLKRLGANGRQNTMTEAQMLSRIDSALEEAAFQWTLEFGSKLVEPKQMLDKLEYPLEGGTAREAECILCRKLGIAIST